LGWGDGLAEVDEDPDFVVGVGADVEVDAGREGADFGMGLASATIHLAALARVGLSVSAARLAPM
jgi:hypothetical protein